MSDEQLPGALPDALEYADSLLISQFDRSRSPILHGFIDELLNVRKTGVDDPLRQLELQASLRTASGQGLDLLGARLKLPRPGVRVPIPTFGFDEAGVGFDQGPMSDARFSIASESPLGDRLYRQLLLGRGYQVRGNASITALERITNAIFGESRWWNVGGGVVAFEACSRDYQLFQVAQRVGLFLPADGVQLCTLHGPWALTTGRAEIIRVFITAGEADTLYERGAIGVLDSVDEVINESAGNDLLSIAWDDTNAILTLTAVGTDNDLATWIATRTLECFVLNQDGDFESSVSITASGTDALAIEFPSSAVFPPTVGDQYTVVIAAVGSVEETGYHLFQRPVRLRRRFRFRRGLDLDEFGMTMKGSDMGRWRKSPSEVDANGVFLRLSTSDATGFAS